MRFIVVTLVLLGWVQAAAAAGFVKSSVLAPAASFVAGKPVTVLCAGSDSAWDAYKVAAYGANDGGNGSTVAGSSTIRLSYLVCESIRLHLQGRVVPLKTLGPTIEVLTHESIHARGVSDEGVADCDAIRQMPNVATTFLHFTTKTLALLMTAARAWRNTEAAAYRTVC